MSGASFCDKSPCEWLQRYVYQLLRPTPDDPKYSPRMVTAVVQPVDGLKGEPIPGIPRVVLFRYCPFCGTRIEGNEDIEEWVEQRRQK